MPPIQLLQASGPLRQLETMPGMPGRLRVVTLQVLRDMKNADLEPEVHLYNIILVACTKLSNPRMALEVYQRCALLSQQPVLSSGALLARSSCIMRSAHHCLTPACPGKV